jgi:TRAP-type C4-dicarboxylate transport system permease small subunit
MNAPKWLAQAATGLAGTALIALVGVQAWQVFARYVLNDSPSWTEPVTILLLVSAMSFGAAAGVHAGRHFAFVLLADALRPRARRALAAVVELVVIAIGATLAWGGAFMLRDGLDIKLAGVDLPQGLVFLPLMLGGALMVLFGLQRLLWPPRAAAATGGE